MTQNFMDDTIMSKIIKKRQASQTESSVGKLAVWSVVNKMNVNNQQINEIIIGPLSCNPPLQLNNDNLTVDGVTWFKLLGITVESVSH